MEEETAVAKSLQEEQNELLARIQAEPSTAAVMETLDRLYGQFPIAVAYPEYRTTFGTGTNNNN